MPIVIETRCARRPHLRGSDPHAAIPACGMNAIWRCKWMSRMSPSRRHEKAGHRSEIARNGNGLSALAVTAKHFDVERRDVANCGRRDGAEVDVMEVRR